MDDKPDSVQSRWDRVRSHVVVRAAAVYGSAVLLVLQVLALLGASTTLIRALAIVFAAGFVFGEGFYLWKSRRPTSAALPRAPERFRRWVLDGRRWVLAAVILLILGAGAWLLGRRLISGSVRPGTDVIAIMPFVASGEDVEVLRIGMISLLSTNFDQVGGIRTIDPGTVLHGWNRRAESGSLDLQGALQVGRDLRAGAILWGSVSAVREDVQVTGEIYTVDGQRVAQGEERGDVDELHALIDGLSVHLLREIWRSNTPVPDLRIAAITTASPPALRSFLRGERYFRAARYDSAIAMFEEAVEADTTFALAYFRLSEAYGWNQHFGAEPSLRAAVAADRHADRLPQRERSLAKALLLHARGDFAALDSLRAITQRYPDDAVAWYLLGDVLVHSQPLLMPTQEEFVYPFRRAAGLDPTPAGGMIHVLEEALYQGDRPLFDEFLQLYSAAAGTERTARWEQLARVRWSPPDSLFPRSLAAVHLFIEQSAPITYLGRVAQIVFARVATDPRLDPAEMIRNQTLAFAAQGTDASADVRRLIRATTLADFGRVREASAVLDSLGSTLAALGVPPPFFLRILWGIHGLYPADSLPPQLARLARDSSMSGNARVITRFLHLSRGEIEAADTVALPTLPPDTSPMHNVALGVKTAADAWGMQLRGDTTSAIDLMRDAIQQAGYSFPAFQGFNSGPLFIHAVALTMRPETRAEGIRRLRFYIALGNGYTVKAYFALARALEAEGNLGEAAEAYAHILRLWKDADPHLQPQVQLARGELARLTGEGRQNTRR